MCTPKSISARVVKVEKSFDKTTIITSRANINVCVRIHLPLSLCKADVTPSFPSIDRARLAHLPSSLNTSLHTQKHMSA